MSPAAALAGRAMSVHACDHFFFSLANIPSSIMTSRRRRVDRKGQTIERSEKGSCVLLQIDYPDAVCVGHGCGGVSPLIGTLSCHRHSLITLFCFCGVSSVLKLNIPFSFIIHRLVGHVRRGS